jgi:hypothetical protein
MLQNTGKTFNSPPTKEARITSGDLSTCQIGLISYSNTGGYTPPLYLLRIFASGFIFKSARQLLDMPLRRIIEGYKGASCGQVQKVIPNKGLRPGICPRRWSERFHLQGFFPSTSRKAATACLKGSASRVLCLILLVAFTS